MFYHKQLYSKILCKQLLLQNLILFTNFNSNFSSIFLMQAHPTTHPFQLLRDGGFHSDGGQKCIKGNVKTFKRAVLLIRYVLCVLANILLLISFSQKKGNQHGE